MTYPWRRPSRTGDVANRFGILDIGSNTVHLLAADADPATRPVAAGLPASDAASVKSG